MAKTDKFSRKYGLFLSDATNEEVVSVSKELMNGISQEIRSLNGTALGTLGVSVISLLLMISLLSVSSITVTGGLKAVVFLTRILAVALLCISAFLSAMVMSRASDASSISSFLWRNVREQADDDKAYEQSQSVRKAGMIMASSKALIKMAALILAFAALSFGIGYTLELLSAYSYI